MRGISQIILVFLLLLICDGLVDAGVEETCNATEVAVLWPQCPDVGSSYLLPEYQGALEGTSTCLGSCHFLQWTECVPTIAFCYLACVDPLHPLCEECFRDLGEAACYKCVLPSYALTTSTQPPAIEDQGDDYCHFSDLIVQDTCNSTVESDWPECSDTLETYLESPNLDPSLGKTSCDSKCTFSKMAKCAGPFKKCWKPCNSDPTSSQCLRCIGSLGIICCDCLAYAVGKVHSTVGQVICNECSKGVGAFGDPHFDTFAGVSYSYHGQCDLVMIQSQQFHNGLGLRVHIRTTRVDASHMSYSYISGAAIQIDNDVLEVMDDGSIILANGSPLFLTDEEEVTGDFSGFPVHKTRAGSSKMIFVYTLFLTDNTSVQIRANTKNGLLFVHVSGGHDLPSDIVGLLGSPTSNALPGRDGTTDLTGFWNNLGESWQVAEDEPKLFQDKNRIPQSPVSCVYNEVPKETGNVRRRRLMDLDGASSMTIEAATQACRNAAERKKGFCVDDVMAVGDLELAEDPFYIS